ncbi:MAG: DUF92 domain-containing protein [Candidatus Aenigmarchaeota archaeon]|nr:DUF92 domain-containing protein [Candidatus Aenigmarchaeota archaeon]
MEMITMFPIIASGVVAVATYKLRILNASGSTAAFALAAWIWWYYGAQWLSILISFMLIGYIATKWKYSQKKQMGIEEGGFGERGAGSVLANGLPAALFLLIASPIGFLGSVATALSDTLASEIGPLAGKARLITGFGSVKPGTDGGVSPLGTLASCVGAFITASLAPLVGISAGGAFSAFIGGIAGCNIDSILGASLERKGLLDKNQVNFISAVFGGLLASILFVFLPW